MYSMLILFGLLGLGNSDDIQTRINNQVKNIFDEQKYLQVLKKFQGVIEQYHTNQYVQKAQIIEVMQEFVGLFDVPEDGAPAEQGSITVEALREHEAKKLAERKRVQDEAITNILNNPYMNRRTRTPQEGQPTDDEHEIHDINDRQARHRFK